jgi:hypothetical protein
MNPRSLLALAALALLAGVGCGAHQTPAPAVQPAAISATTATTGPDLLRIAEERVRGCGPNRANDCDSAEANWQAMYREHRPTEDAQCPVLHNARRTNLDYAARAQNAYDKAFAPTLGARVDQLSASFAADATHDVILAHDLGCDWAASAIIRDGKIEGWRST